VVKEALLLTILRMLDLPADSMKDVQRLNGSRPYVQRLVARAHKAAIDIDAAVRDDLVRRRATWKRGEEKPQEFPSDLLAAVSMRESTFDEEKVGKAGEIGLTQIKPDGRGAEVCTDLDIAKNHDNLLCAIRLLREGIKKCGDVEGGLSYYNGTRTCKSTGYSRRVLGTLDAARPKMVAER
jgi:hypothetical protein